MLKHMQVGEKPVEEGRFGRLENKNKEEEMGQEKVNGLVIERIHCVEL